MVLSKSFKTKPRKEVEVEVQITDKDGKPHNFCADHDVFAVEPGPFVVDVEVTGAADLHAKVNRHNGHQQNKVVIQLKIDGHVLGVQYMHSQDKYHHKFETQRIIGLDGVARLHALVFDTPQENNNGGATANHGASASSGDTGKVELHFVEVVVTAYDAPCKTSGYGIDAKAAKGGGRQDKKFFMQQGVAFKTGECVATQPQNTRWSTFAFVKGGLDFTVEFLYDMKAFLQLRGAVPYSDDDEPAAVAPKRRRTEAHGPGKLSSGNQVKEEIDLTAD